MTVVIPDIHGRKLWKEIVNIEGTDCKYVFLGDYFDSFHISKKDQLNNYLDIIAFKEANMDSVVMLAGNHSYIEPLGLNYSGFTATKLAIFQWHVNDAVRRGLIDIHHIEGKYLFTHAGLTNTFCQQTGIDVNNLDKSLSDFWRYRPQVFQFNPGDRHDAYGNEMCQSPIWIRPPALAADYVKRYVHIVGHTPSDRITKYTFGYVVDCHPHSRQYLVIQDDKEYIREF